MKNLKLLKNFAHLLFMALEVLSININMEFLRTNSCQIEDSRQCEGSQNLLEPLTIIPKEVYRVGSKEWPPLVLGQMATFLL